jgi:2-dehydropantoate 2-reductase
LPGASAQLRSDVQHEIWQKYVFLVGLSGTTPTIRRPIGPVRENAQTHVCYVVREVAVVACGQGIDLPSSYAQKRLVLADDLAYDTTRGSPHEVRWLSEGWWSCEKP